MPSVRFFLTGRILLGGMLLSLAACKPASPAAAPPAASAATPLVDAAVSAPSATTPASAAQYADAPTPPLASQAAATGIPPQVAALLDQARIRADAVTLLVAPADGGAPLVNYRSTVPMNPASVMKLVTTAAALDVLGPAYAWRTPVWADGTLRQGTLHGNVYMQGRGDPKLVLERLWLLLRQLRQSGIETIDGDLVLDNSAFDVPPHDPGAFDGEPLRPYNAAPDALLVNYKALVLNFAPDPLQQVAHVSADPPLTGVDVAATVSLASGGCGLWQNQLKAQFGDSRAVRFAGSYPASCGVRSWAVAYAAPEQFAARAIAGMWLAAGGQITGSVRHGVVPQAIRQQPPTAQGLSPALSEVIRDINKYSNNVMAQQVFLTLGLEQAGVGTPATAQTALADWWRSRLGQTPPPVVDNGSGLSRTARISASSLAAMLQVMWQTPGMPEFMSSLPISGVDGTLRRSRLRARGSAHLKTGTLDDASALAGYVLGDNGRQYVLVAIANGPGAPAARLAFEALVDWTVRLPQNPAALAAPASTAANAVRDAASAGPAAASAGASSR